MPKGKLMPKENGLDEHNPASNASSMENMQW